VTGDAGAKLENVTAVCLRKWLHFLEDTKGNDTRLYYIRDKEKREVDFLIEIDKKIDRLLEVKVSEENLSGHLAYFNRKLNPRESIQLVQTLTRTKTVQGIFIAPAADWLMGLDI
jgi:predicted AAA+ superfamily ATPase